MKRVYEDQGLDLISDRFSCREGLLTLTVSNVWYAMSCGIRRQTYIVIRDSWRRDGGSNLTMRDMVGTTVADFRIHSSSPCIEGCD